MALDSLGYSPCFHARFFPYLTEFFDTLYEHAVGRRPDFPAKRLFRQFNSAVDIPAPLIPMVMEAFPDAKVTHAQHKNHDCCAQHLILGQLFVDV